MEGSEIAVAFLARNGVRVCFGNPGTTELNLVGALAHQDGIRYVPTLHEAVAVGAADGYHRIAGHPAMSLLHNGIGLSNALTGLFNARRGGSASVIVVGDHSDALQPHRDVLSSGVRIAEAALSAVAWCERVPSGDAIEQTFADALAAAGGAPGGPVVVALPYDIAWSDWGQSSELASTATKAAEVTDERISAIAAVLRRGRKAALLLGNDATRTEDALTDAGRIRGAAGCRLLSRPAVLVRGAGRVPVEQYTYSPLHSVDQLRDVDDLILVGAHPPVIPWGYPTHESILMTRQDAEIHVLATPDEDVPDALRRLADHFAGAEADIPHRALPAIASGAATPAAVAQSLAALLPADAIFLNEGISNGSVFQDSTEASRPHTLLTNVGGAIGWAQSAAIGCALAAPERKVVVVQGDGAAMYTPQALWTIAREKLDVLVVILANRTYKVLEYDLEFRGITDAHDLMRMDQPAIDWVSIAQGMGVQAAAVGDMDGFNAAFEAGVAAGGPRLIVVDLAD